MNYAESSKNNIENGWFEFAGFEMFETGRQEHSGNNCIFAAGHISEKTANPPFDTLYLVAQKDGVEPTIILLRHDEMATLAWLTTGAIYSVLATKLLEGEK